MQIILDAGHGAGKKHNRGGIYYNEGDNNFYYSLVLKEELEKYKNVKVELTRSKITDNPSLSQRANMGKGHDLFLSLHSNAGAPNAGAPNVRGSEVWDSVERPNKALAQAIVNNTSNLFKHNNRGVRYKVGQPGYNWYGVLRFNQARSAMILEIGFHTNKKDCLYFRNHHWKIAQEHIKAIANHYNLKSKDNKIASKPNTIMNKNAPSIWAKEAWDLTKVKGYLDGTRPKEGLTREELASVIVRVLEG